MSPHVQNNQAAEVSSTLLSHEEHLITIADRAFKLQAYDDDRGYSAAGHVELFLEIAQAQARALWILAEKDWEECDITEALSPDQVRSMIAGIDLMISLSGVMVKEITK